MELEELIQCAGSKDFAANLAKLDKKLAVVREAETDLNRQRNLIDRKSDEIAVAHADLEKRERSVRSKESAVTRKQEALAERLLKVTEAETKLHVREVAAGQKESASEDRMSKAVKMEESNAAERERLERRISYLDKIPA